MNNTYAKFILIGLLVSCSLSKADDNGTAPTLDPADEAKELIADDGSKITINVSGGTTPAPTSKDGCGPWTPGTLKYVWTYSEIQGDPHSGTASEAASLKLNRDLEKKSSVTVMASRQYTGRNDAKVTKSGPASSPVAAAVQVPTKLKFDKSAKSGSGGAYTFIVQDKWDQPLRNKSVSLIENFDEHDVKYKLTTGHEDILFTNQAVTDAEAATGPTDDDGKITDSPVDIAALSDLEKNAKDYYNGNSNHYKMDTITRKFTHKYKIKYGEHMTDELLSQEQTIVIKFTWDSNNKPTASVDSVSP